VSQPTTVQQFLLRMFQWMELGYGEGNKIVRLPHFTSCQVFLWSATEDAYVNLKREYKWGPRQPLTAEVIQMINQMVIGTLQKAAAEASRQGGTEVVLDLNRAEQTWAQTMELFNAQYQLPNGK
jgi:hypothetical protein